MSEEKEIYSEPQSNITPPAEKKSDEIRNKLEDLLKRVKLEEVEINGGRWVEWDKKTQKKREEKGFFIKKNMNI